MPSIGGGIIKQFSFSKAWGINPSAASGTILLDPVGGGFSLSAGDYVAYSFGSLASFLGIVTSTGEVANFGQGAEQTFEVSDNRVRMGWQMVFGAWNIEDDTASVYAARPDSPSTGSNQSVNGTEGASFLSLGDPPEPVAAGAADAPEKPWEKRRRYRHLLPEHWQSGIWTWTDRPLTTRQILNSAFNHAWGDFGFTRNYHNDLDDSVLVGLDYTTGIKLSNLVSEINSRCGLDISISGSRTLVWGRKGDGIPPVPDPSCSPFSSGASLTSVDTGIRVVGDRVRIQRLNVTLEPDWKSGWNKFIDELAWLREVAVAFEKPTATKADLLDLAAFARQVTVYQYAKKKNDPSLLDARPFGRVSRSQLPAWVYIRELVYRSYRIPTAFRLHGIPLSSLDIADSLLAATDVEGEGDAAKQVYASSPIQFYPSVQCSAIVKGQPLDLINSRDIRLFYRNTTRDLRNEWTVAADFELDAVNKSIRFQSPTFIDGDYNEGESIYLRVNRGEGGGDDLTSLVSEGSDYLDVVVPNPGFKIAPAEVRASFCFLLGNFFKDYGKGPRRGSISASGLGLHVLDMASDSGFTSGALKSLPSSEIRAPSPSGQFKELLFEDGGSAIEKADAIARSQLQLSGIQATGGFTRNGVVGTSLTPVVDRITVNVDFNSGITEQVEYTKARSTSVALAERTLQRIQRTEELFSGQDALKKEIREYRMLASAMRPRLRGRARSHVAMPDVFEKPVGSEYPGTVVVKDRNNVAPTRDGVKRWLAGDLVWLDGKGVPAASGVFGGVVVTSAANEGTESSPQYSKDITIAYSGRVPVRVKSSIPVNSVIMADPGDHVGKVTGSVVIGRLAHGDGTPNAPSGELTAMVDLGGGGSSSAGVCYFGEIITWDEGSGSTPESKTGVRGGIIEAGKDQWWEANHEIDAATDREKLLWIELDVTANTTTDGSAVLSAIKEGNRESVVWNEGDLSTGYPDKTVPPIFPTGAGTPGAGKIILPIGIIKVKDGVIGLTPAGCGHFVVVHCPGNLSYERRGDLAIASSSSSS